jgi:hypothetical protein
VIERRMTLRNDFSPYNRAVEFEQERKNAHLLALHRRTRIQEILAKGAVLIGVVLAIALALAQLPGLLGWGKAGAQVAALPAVPPGITTAERDAARAGEVVNYTLFREVPSELNGFGNVVTGSVFTSSADARPAVEYCYLELPRSNAVSNRIDLAIVPAAGQGSQVVPWSVADLAAVDLSHGQALGLTAKCRFLDASAQVGIGAPA